jgi:hypothetical protein
MEAEADNEYWEKPRINIGIRGEHLNSSSITEELGIVPTKTFSKGEHLSGGLSPHKYASTVWSWSTEGKLSATSMEEHAEFLLSVLEPKKDKLSKYLNDPACLVFIWIDWQSNYDEGCYVLSTAIIQRLAALCKRMHFGFLIDE